MRKFAATPLLLALGAALPAGAVPEPAGLVSTQAAGNDLPWALYRAQALSPTGMFAGVTSIQRVDTRGGVAPASGCSSASVGAETRVGFTADYYFYKRRGAG